MATVHNSLVVALTIGLALAAALIAVAASAIVRKWAILYPITIIVATATAVVVAALTIALKSAESRFLTIEIFLQLWSPSSE